MTPRAFLLTAVLALPAAVLGYFMGKSGSASLSLRTRQTLTNPSSPPGAGTGERIAALKISAMKVRSAPASRSEEAWVKWAFAVPDRDLADAVASLNPLTDFHALRVLFSRWVRLDPQAAWKAFEAIPIPDQSTRWYEGGGETGLSLTSSTLQNGPRGLILGRMLHSWHSSDPAAAVAYTEKLKAERKPATGSDWSMANYEIDRFLKESSSFSPGRPDPQSSGEWRDAMSAAAEEMRRDRRSSSSYDTMRKWASADPESAARWLLAQQTGESVPPETTNCLQYLSKADPSLRMQLFSAAVRDAGALQKALDILPRTQPGQEGMNPEFYNELKQLHFGMDALKDWMSADPDKAKTWLASQPEGPLKSVLYSQAAAALSQSSPKEAIALLNNVADADLPAAVTALTNGWAAWDAKACAEWVDQIEDIPVRDASRTAIARQVMGADPAMALRLTLGIADETARTALQKEITSALGWNPGGLRHILFSDVVRFQDLLPLPNPTANQEPPHGEQN